MAKQNKKVAGIGHLAPLPEEKGKGRSRRGRQTRVPAGDRGDFSHLASDDGRVDLITGGLTIEAGFDLAIREARALGRNPAATAASWSRAFNTVGARFASHAEMAQSAHRKR